MNIRIEVVWDSYPSINLLWKYCHLFSKIWKNAKISGRPENVHFNGGCPMRGGQNIFMRRVILSWGLFSRGWLIPSAHYGYRKGTLTNWKIVAFIFERACKARDLDRFLIHFCLEIIFWIFCFRFDKFSRLLENIKKETISEICWPIIFTFVFRTSSNIYDGAFLRKLKTVSIFRKNM